MLLSQMFGSFQQCFCIRTALNRLVDCSYSRVRQIASDGRCKVANELIRLVIGNVDRHARKPSITHIIQIINVVFSIYLIMRRGVSRGSTL